MKVKGILHSAAVVLGGLASMANVQAQETSRGEYLARAGNCVVCHTVPGGKPFAGGLKMDTPVGAIYTTNITPDRETGIGAYTPADFNRALRQGIAKDGHRLYPAMPYPSYAKISDVDAELLYRYFMYEVAAVTQPNRANEVKWPWSIRWPLALWSFAMTAGAPYRPDPKADATWNRGAYLVQGLGHCGACHTPRGWAFQEIALDQRQTGFLAGARLDNWYASNLTADNADGLGRWSEQAVIDFLKSGRNQHGAAFGTMTDVVSASTQHLTDSDLAAIAKYLKSLPPTSGAKRADYIYDDKTANELRASSGRAAVSVYVRHCESCHMRDGRGQPPYIPPLAGNPALIGADPSSLINIVLNGSSRIVAGGVPDIYRMAPYRVLLSDQAIADVATFVRSSWGNRAGPVTGQEVAAIRASTDAASERAVVLRMR